MIGNNNIKEQLNIALSATQKRNTALPHILFSGPAGCGKTTLAKEIATIGGMDFMQATSDSVKGYRAVLDLLSNINHIGYNKQGDVVGRIKPTIIFLDEIHRLPISGQEHLGIAMEEFQLESDQDKKSYIWFPLFTIIGATTEEGLLSKPYRDRFKLLLNFKLYDEETLALIVSYHAEKKKVKITKNACFDISKRSKGTPRLAVKYLERAIDFALWKNLDVITPDLTKTMFEGLGIDPLGLSDNERTLLISLYNSEKPVGLNNLSVIINASQKTITDSIEPFLMYKGLITVSGRGRVLTRKGMDYVSEEILQTGTEKTKRKIDANYSRKLTL